MYCTRCGKEVGENSKFCFHCGANLQDDSDGVEGTCAISSFLSRRGDRFYLRVKKKILVGTSVWLAAMSIAGAFAALIPVPALLKAQGGGQFEIAMTIFLIAVSGLLICFAIPVVRKALSYKNLPVESGRLYFRKENIKELEVYRLRFVVYSFLLVLDLGHKTVALPLGIKPADTREQAQRIVDELVNFIGGNIPVRWSRLSLEKLKRIFREG